MVIDMRRHKPSDFKRAPTYRVMADGKDVTRNCFYVDTRRRRIGLYLAGENGQPYVDPSNRYAIAKQWLHPKCVRLVRRIQ